MLSYVEENKATAADGKVCEKELFDQICFASGLNSSTDMRQLLWLSLFSARKARPASD